MIRQENKWFVSLMPFHLAVGISQTLIALHVISIGGNVADVGLATAVNSAALVPSSILWGKISDSMGKRKVFLLLGLGGMGALLAALYLTSTVSQVLLLSCIMGLVLASSNTTTSMLLVETTAKKNWDRVMGTYNTIAGTGIVLGLLVGALLSIVLELRLLFLTASISSFVSFFLALKVIREPIITIERHQTPFTVHLISEKIRLVPHLIFNLPIPPSLGRLRRLMGFSLTRDLPVFYLCTFLFFTGSNLVATIIPAYLKDRGITDTGVFSAMVVMGLFSTISYRRAGRMSEALGEKRLMVRALVLRTVLFPAWFGLVFLNSGSWNFALALGLVVAIHGVSFSFFWIPSSVLLPKFSARERLGEAQGNFNAVIGVSAIFGAMLGGFIVLLGGFASLFLVATGLILGSWLAVTRLQAEQA